MRSGSTPHDTGRDPLAPRPWVDSGLARLAFGSVGPRDPTAIQATSHLAFLPTESLELDLADPAQRMLGDYELLEILGEGGMGVVYRARQRNLEREVALKLLAAGPWASQEFISGFRREARNAALLQHPNIVAIHDMGEHDGLIYYVMELMRGQSLARRLRRGPLSPREAASLLRTIAEAVDYAHRLGVLHLDLKPGNVLLESEGTPKVSDFGLARRLGQALSLENEQVSGTPCYMAPEQAQVRSSRLTVATDVWGLGAILYEALTGMPPFLADSPQETLRLVIEGRVRRPSRVAAVPHDLEAICLHCLEKDPAQRYPNARALADDLGRFLEGRTVSVRPLRLWQRAGRWARREPRLAALAGIAALAVLGGLAVSTREWQRAEGNADAIRKQLWSQRGDQAWRSIREGNSFDALAPLTQSLLEQEQAGAAREAAITRMRIGSVLANAPALVATIAVERPVFTVLLAPDGRWIAAGTDDGFLHLYDLPSGRERWRTDTRTATHFLMQAPHLGHLRMASDGRHLLVARPYPDPMPNPSGLNQLRVDLRDGGLWSPSEPDFRDATFSPDGGYALVRSNALRARMVRASDGRALGPWREFDARNPAWLVAPQGRLVAMATAEWRRVELWDGASLKTRRVLHFGDESPMRSWSFTPDGRQLALGHHDGQISLIDTGTGARENLRPQHAASVERLRVSDDGQWLAAAYDDGYALVWELPRRKLLTPPIRAIEKFFGFDLDPATRTLMVSDELTAAVWRIPTRPGQARLLHRRPDLPETRYGRSNSWAPAVGLLAAGTKAGEIRIWRTRRQVPLPWPPASQPVATAFDGRHVIAVDGERVQVMDALSRRPVGRAVMHPQPVGFAFLTGDAHALVTSAGRRIRVTDWRTGRQRFGAILLDNTPNRLLATPDGQALIASELIWKDQRGLTRLTAWSLENGRRQATTTLESPVHGTRLSSDGRSLLLWRIGELHVLDAHSLVPRGRMQRIGPDAFATRRALYAKAGPVEVKDPDAFWGTGFLDADAAGDRVWALTDQLLEFPLTGGPPIRRIPIPSQFSVLIEAAPDGNVDVLTLDRGVLVLSRTGSLQSTVLPARVDIGLTGRSGDGQRLAVSSGDGVVVYDIDGNWLTVPMAIGDDPSDLLFALTLDRHGDTLLAETLGGRYVVAMPPARRPARQLATLAPIWRPPDLPELSSTAVPAPAARTRYPLDPRQRDPGPASMSPLPEHGLTDAPLPPHDPRFVDLRPACNLPMQEPGPDAAWPPVPALRTLPRGQQRMLDRDFWIDCGVMMSMSANRPLDPERAPLPGRSGMIPVAMHEFGALDVLLTGWGTTASFVAVPYATVELRYRDGSSATLSIEGRSQVWAWWHEASDLPEQPLAYLSQFARTSRPSSWLSLARHYAVRLRNPHPERPVVALEFAATDQAWSSPIVLAVTLLPESNAPQRQAVAESANVGR